MRPCKNIEPVLVGLLFGCLTSSEAWQWRNPLPTGSNLCSIVWAGAKYVAVGEDGVVLTAEHSEHWQKQRSGTNQHLLDVAAGPHTVVAVGCNGTIISSPDGTLWTRRATTTEQDLYSITRAGDRFVAVGEGGTVLTSPDGIDWLREEPGTDKSLYSCAWTGQGTVAVGRAGVVIRSADNSHWKVSSIPPEYDCIGIVWSGTKLYAIGNHMGQGKPALGLTRPTEFGDPIDFSGELYESDDGSTWNRLRHRVYYAVGCVDTVLVASTYEGEWDWFTEAEGWRESSTKDGLPMYGMCTHDDTMFAVGAAGLIQKSVDGRSWVPCVGGSNRPDFADVTWAGGRFVSVGQNGTIALSDNGLAWDIIDSAAGEAQLSSIVWDGGKYVAVSWTGEIVSSQDGRSWQVEHREGMLYAITSSYDRLVAVGQSIILTSKGGRDWRRADVPLVDAALHDVCWSGTMFAAVGAQGIVLSSGDGVTWTRCELREDISWNAIAWTGSEFVAAGESGKVLTAGNDLTWVTHQAATQSDLLAVTVAGGVAVIVGAEGTVLVRSSSGEWVTATAPRVRLTGVAAKDGLLVAVGEKGTILTTQYLETSNGIAGAIGPIRRQAVIDHSARLAACQRPRLRSSASYLPWSNIAVFDPCGRRVSNAFAGSVCRVGEQRVDLGSANRASGSYFVVVQYGEDHRILPMLLLR